MWEVTERVGKRGKEGDEMQGTRDNAASREIVEATPAFVCVCGQTRMWTRVAD